MTTEEVLIKIDVTEISGKLAANTKAINDLKEANKKLADEYNASKGTDTAKLQAIEANKIAIKSFEAESRTYQKEIQNEIKAQQNAIGSVNKLSAEVANMTAKYDKMSQAERESAKGQEFINKLNETREALVAAKEETGRFQDNVGNYPKEIGLSAGSISDLNGTLGDLITRSQDAGGASALLQNGIKGGAASMVQFIKAALAFIATPVGATLAAIAAAVLLIKNAMDRSEESTAKVMGLFGKFRGAANGLLKILEPLGDFVINYLVFYFTTLEKVAFGVADAFAAVAEFAGFDKVAKNVKDYTGEIKASVKAGEELTKAELELDKARRISEKTQLDYQKQAEKLRQLRDDESKSIPERIAANQRLGEVLKKQQSEELKLAQKAIDYANLKIKLNGENKENLDLLAEAQTKVSDIQERISGQESEQLMNLNSLRKEAADKRKELAENSAKIEQQLQDALIANTKKGVELEIEQEKLATARKIEELKKQTGLTKKGIEDRNKLIEQLQIQSDNKVKELTDAASEEKIKAAYDTEQKRLQILIDGATEGSKEELDLQLQKLEKERENAVKAKGLQADEIAAINAKYREDEEKLNDDYNAKIQQKELEIYKTNLDNKLAIAQENSDLEYQLKLEKLEVDRIAEVEAAEKTGADIALIEEKYNKLRGDLEGDLLNKRLSAISGSLNTINGLFEKNTEAYKNIATAQALIDTYKSANAAYSSVAAVPIVGQALGIAAAAAAVAAGLKQIQAINSTKIPKAQKFADGGIVQGTSFYGDNIPAFVNSGEMILNRGQQSNLFKLVQNVPQAGGIDYNKMAQAMSNIRPVVSVSEINNVNSRVDTLETLSNY